MEDANTTALVPQGPRAKLVTHEQPCDQTSSLMVIRHIKDELMVESPCPPDIQLQSLSCDWNGTLPDEDSR